MTVTVRIVVCPCKNGGQCSPHPYHPRGSGLYSCKCPTGLTGDRCEINIDDCISVNCGNGTCIDGINNYTCKCNVGFEGPSCDKKTHNCTKQSCFAGVQCTETSSGISCGPCPNGMSGDGKTCTLGSTSTPAYTSRSTFVVASREISSTSFITPKPTSTFVGPEPSASSSFPVPDSRSTSSFASSVVHTPTVTYSSPESRSTSSVSSELKVNITSVSAVPESRPTSSIVTSKVTSASQEISSTTATMPPTISPSKTKTATAPTSSVDKVTEYIVSAVLRINREWDNAFLDNELEKFKILASEVEQEIFKAYSSSANDALKTVKVISFRRGSIIVDFELMFRKKQSDPLLPLKESLKDGKLGTIEAYPESLKEKNKDSEKPTKVPTKPNLTLILVLAGVGFVIFIFAVVVLYMCRNHLKRRVYHLTKKRQSSKVIIEEDDQDCKDNIEMSREFHHGAPLPKKVGLDMEAGSTNAGYHD